MRTKPPTPIPILIADDDPDDRLLTQEAFAESRLTNSIHFVENGEELMNYLQRQGKYQDAAIAPRPGIILLDLNMPRKDGREAIRDIKADPTLRHIPIVVLTTSNTEQDIRHSYDLGVSSFIIKPVTFAGLVKLIQALAHYWFEIVQLPNQD